MRPRRLARSLARSARSSRSSCLTSRIERAWCRRSPGDKGGGEHNDNAQQDFVDEAEPLSRERYGGRSYDAEVLGNHVIKRAPADIEDTPKTNDANCR